MLKRLVGVLASFDTLEGDSLRHLFSSKPALSSAFLAGLPLSDQLRARDNTLETQPRGATYTLAGDPMNWRPPRAATAMLRSGP